MLKASLFGLYILFKSLIAPCYCDNRNNGFQSPEKIKYKINKKALLPNCINESSGVVVITEGDSTFFYTINDSDGPETLYAVDLKGKLLNTYPVPNAKNIDWEDITSDTFHNIYIGDFGNNLNRRKNLKIYKYNLKSKVLKTIAFKYQDQCSFPPPRDSFNYDCEAFFWHQDSLYLFSKNRAGNSVRMYRLSDQEGEQVAIIQEEIFLNGMITGASVSPQGDKFALLSYGKVYIFGIQNNQISFDHPLKCRRFPRSGQSEGIGFINNTDLLITNEAGKIFLMKRR